MLSKKFLFNSFLLITSFSPLHPVLGAFFDEEKPAPGHMYDKLDERIQQHNPAISVRKFVIEQFLAAQQNVFGCYLNYQGEVHDCHHGAVNTLGEYEPCTTVKTVAVDRNLNQEIFCYYTDGATIFYDFKEGQSYPFPEVGYVISAAAFNQRNSIQAATASYDAQLSNIKVDVWDVRDRSKAKSTFTPHTQMVTGLAFYKNFLYSSSLDGTVYCYDVNTNDCCCLINNPEIGITCMALSTDGEYLITGGDDNVARIWDTRNARELRHFDCKQFNDIRPVRGNAIINTISIDDNNRYVFIGSDNGAAVLWNLGFVFDPSDGKWEYVELTPHCGVPCTATFSHDSELVLVGFTSSQLQEIRCWNLHDAQFVKPGNKSVMLWGSEQYRLPHSADLLHFSKNNNIITAILHQGPVVQWLLTNDSEPIVNALEQYDENQIGFLVATNEDPKATNRALLNKDDETGLRAIAQTFSLINITQE